MAWISKAEAAALISVDASNITDANLAMAVSTVEAFINREVEDIPSINERDLRRIKKAIAWQAIFLNDQPDYGYRTLINSASADGQSFQMVNAAGGGVDIAAQMLHPITIRYLRNLTWKRQPIGVDKTATLIGAYQSFLNESSDSDHGWEKLG
jgi:hypothetical protein